MGCRMGQFDKHPWLCTLFSLRYQFRTLRYQFKTLRYKFGTLRYQFRTLNQNTPILIQNTPIFRTQRLTQNTVDERLRLLSTDRQSILCQIVTKTNSTTTIVDTDSLNKSPCNTMSSSLANHAATVIRTYKN